MARLLDARTRGIDRFAVRLDLGVVKHGPRTWHIRPIVFDIDLDAQWLTASVAADSELRIEMRIGCAVLVAERPTHPPLAHQRSGQPGFRLAAGKKFSGRGHEDPV